MPDACIFHIFQIKIHRRIDGKDCSNDEPKERTLTQSQNSTIDLEYLPGRMKEKLGWYSLLGLGEEHNYDTYFIIEAEIIRISMKGKTILILKARIWKVDIE